VALSFAGGWLGVGGSGFGGFVVGGLSAGGLGEGLGVISGTHSAVGAPPNR
jgi:hypothetical protein